MFLSSYHSLIFTCTYHLPRYSFHGRVSVILSTGGVPRCHFLKNLPNMAPLLRMALLNDNTLLLRMTPSSKDSTLPPKDGTPGPAKDGIPY